MNDFDPLKDEPLRNAFAERSNAARTLDIEGGLAGLHRHNSPGRRMAKAGGALMVGLIALGGAGIALSSGGDDVELDNRVAETPEVETTVPEDSAPADPDAVTVPSSLAPPDSTPEPLQPDPVRTDPPALIVTDASTSVLVNGVRYEMGIGPIVDAIDFAGGVIFATDDAIWNYRSNSLEPVKLVEAGPAGALVLHEVAVDVENADSTVFFTEWGGDDNDDPAQYLSKLALGSDTGVQRLARVGGGELAVIDAGVGGQHLDSSLIATVSTTGPCSSLTMLNGTTGETLDTEMRCGEEGGGTFEYTELFQAVDLTDDGALVWADQENLKNDTTGSFIPTIDGNPKWIDIWGDWAVVAKRGNSSQVDLVHLPTDEVISTTELPANFTSARPLRSQVDLADAPDFETFSVESANYVVIDVADDDALNMRSGPGVSYSVVGEVPNGDIVTTTGNAARLPGGAEWYELDINGLSTTWVNSKYLELLETTPGGLGNLACQVDGADPANHLLPQTSAAGASDVDHVASVTQTTSGNGCVRTTVQFGEDFSYDDPGPIGALPGGISVKSSLDGKSILVELPASVNRVGFDDLRSGTAVVTGDGVEVVSLEILAGPHGAAAFFDDASNTLVVDYVALPTLPGQLAVPLFDGAGVIIRNIDGYSEGPSGPVISGQARVQGFAQPFEAQLGMDLLDSDGNAVDDVLWNAGRPDEATGTGFFGPMVPWMVLGSFDFTFEGLDPGSYTIRFSNNADAADEPTWLSLPFTIQ